MKELIQQIDTLDNKFVDGIITVEQFFAKCEQIMDHAYDDGLITDEEYCELERYAGF